MRNSVRRALCATAMAGGLTVLAIALATSSAAAADRPGTTTSTGVLPDTGASATLLLLLLVGLVALFGGLYMVRAERTATRRRKERSRSGHPG